MTTYFQEAIKNIKYKNSPHQYTSTNSKTLFAVVTLANKLEDRIPVVCDSFDKANEIVVNNYGDIYEYSYSLVVIEEFILNKLYANSVNEYWYYWSLEDECYKPIEKPEVYSNIVGFGIG